jgi:hypothetical protein
VAANDEFRVPRDGPGAEASARVNLVFDPLAPVAPPVINPPQPQSDGTVLLSGNAPPGSVVVIYRTTDVSESYWNRDVTVTVPGSGQWSIIRPGSAGGVTLFYKAEMQPAM